MKNDHKKVFLAALDWGWGHVTRSIALVHQLLGENKTVILGGSGISGAMLKNHFPELTYYELVGYAITFDDTQNVYWQMMKKIPEINKVMIDEQEALEEIVQKEHPDVVISDHRYGLRHNATRNIILCHQLNLQAGNYSRIINGLHHSLLDKFDEIWVPDFEDRKLSGDLSMPVAKLENKVHFIGPLTTMQVSTVDNPPTDVLILCTGPEPQRTNFEQKICDALNNDASSKKGVVIQGAKESPVQWPEGWEVIGVADRGEVNEYINNAQKIITRSGYSTLMDLNPFLITTLFIPTPGQKEQEALAKHLKGVKSAVVAEQSSLNQEVLTDFIEGE